MFLFYKVKYVAVFLIIFYLFALLLNIWFPHEAFCMDPFENITSEEDITSEEGNMSDEDLGSKLRIAKNDEYFFSDEDDISDEDVRSRLWIARRENYYSCKGYITDYTRLDILESLYPRGLPLDYNVINDSYDGEIYFDLPLTMIYGQSKNIDLSPGVYYGCMASNIDGLLIWPEHLPFQVEFAKDYTQVLAKDSNISSVSLGINILDRVVFVYIKCQDINKRKYHWTIWERTHLTKYWSYKAFKKRWDTETNVWSNLDDNIRKDIIIEVKDLLGIKRVDGSVRKSVRSEVGKLIHKTKPFSTFPS